MERVINTPCVINTCVLLIPGIFWDVLLIPNLFVGVLLIPFSFKYLHILFAHEIFFSWTLQLKIQKNSGVSVQIFLAEEVYFFTGLDDFMKKYIFHPLGVLFSWC